VTGKASFDLFDIDVESYLETGTHGDGFGTSARTFPNFIED
jgi:hypothetical protein